MKKDTLIKSHTGEMELLNYGKDMLLANPVLLDMCSHRDKTSFFIHDLETYQDVKEALTILRRTGLKLELGTYYTTSMGECLAIHYHGKEGEIPFSVNFYCREPELALEKLSGGKCQIVTREKTKKEVVCGVEGGEG